MIRRFDTPLICVIGKPPVSAIKEAVSKSVAEVEVLTYRESVTCVGSALSGWQKEAAVIHEFSNPVDMNEEIDEKVRLANENELSGLEDEFPELAIELLKATRFSPIAAFFVKNRPVSFCYSTCENRNPSGMFPSKPCELPKKRACRMLCQVYDSAYV